jgi:hypothetical protein
MSGAWLELNLAKYRTVVAFSERVVCSLTEAYRRSGETCCRLLQSRRMTQANSERRTHHTTVHLTVTAVRTTVFTFVSIDLRVLEYAGHFLTG